MIKRILLALGGTPLSPSALSRAVELAQLHDAQITAVPVLDLDYWKQVDHTLLTAGEAAQRLEQRPWRAAERQLLQIRDRFDQTCRKAAVTGQFLPVDKRPLETLISQWRYHDLVVFGLRGLFDYGIVPDPQQTISDLIGRGVRPILAVAAKHKPIHRVLIAYSGSAESAKAMKRFVQMRLYPDVALQLVCFGHRAAEAHRLLSDACDYCHAHGFEATVEHVAGPARRELLDYAQRNRSDLIVLGDSYRSVLSGEALGETMLHAIRHADRPLFLSH